jgi:hypothetical protein
MERLSKFGPTDPHYVEYNKMIFNEKTIQLFFTFRHLGQVSIEVVDLFQQGVVLLHGPVELPGKFR